VLTLVSCACHRRPGILARYFFVARRKARYEIIEERLDDRLWFESLEESLDDDELGEDDGFEL
ncbi:MAG: hypothetical protein P1U64_09860, partial [Alcanivoracaceae bacterium]|nr:hypothetical protein [Alcanivoracaceae bacterium]